YLVHRGGTDVVPSASRTYFPGNAGGIVIAGFYNSASDDLGDAGALTWIGTNSAAPATPVTGQTWAWTDSTDKRWHDKNDAGTVGTAVVARTWAAKNYANSVSAAGVIACAQPQASDLSNYAEGTCTPVLTFGTLSTGITYTTQGCTFTRVGRLVFLTVNIVLSSKGSAVGSASIAVSGLPGNAGDTFGFACVGNNFAAAVATQLNVQMATGGTAFTPGKFAAGANANLTDSDFNNNTILRFSGAYSL